MNIFRSVSQIINYKTFIIATLAVISQYLCRSFDVHADFPVTILGLALVFPIVFSINSAYERRERALGLLGDFKAHALAVFYAARFHDMVE